MALSTREITSLAMGAWRVHEAKVGKPENAKLKVKR
jgi:hypothetical protein